MATYDTWLEKHFQDQADRDSAYEAALEAATETEFSRLMTLTVEALLEESDVIHATLQQALYLPMTSVPSPHKPLSFCLTSLLEALAKETAETQLATQDDDFDPPDEPDPIDGDCDYWSRTR